MKILITGNMGYIGPVVVEQMREAYPNATIAGLDIGYFAHCLTGVPVFPEYRVHEQFFADVRNPPARAFEGATAVIYLSAISNDPMGNFFEKPTQEINAESAVAIAKYAKECGARSFVYASSCSMYGSASGGARTEDDSLNPLTAYARSKVYTEKELALIASDSFVVTSLRFSTACGMSPRLRLDLVLNDFVASAVAGGKITILSDGTPWRPLIHIRDMARAIEWAIKRESGAGGRFLPINVGRDDWNYQVKDLACAVAECIGGVKISINPNAAPDKRSYKVDFSRFASLAPGHQPRYDLEMAVKDLYDGLSSMRFNNPDFRDTEYMRLKVLKNHITSKRLDNDLCWLT